MTILYLGSADVRSALPSPERLVDLAEIALRSLVAGAEVPEKAALSPSRNGVFAHAMPARLTAGEVPGGGAPADLLGTKWIAGGPGNRAAGLPALSSLIVLNDPESGRLRAVMDGDVITAARTAALSGVAVRLLGPRPGASGTRAVLVGAGSQGHAHAAMLGALLPGVELVVHDRHPERAEALSIEASKMAGVRNARSVADPKPSLAAADVIVTATSLGGSRPVLGPGDIAPDALVLPVDYGAYVSSALVAAATTFAVDDRRRFEANRRSGRLAGWPDPSATLGELLLGRPSPPAGRPSPPAGRPERPPRLAVALHQGPGIADVIVADAVLRQATADGLGLELTG